MSDQLEQAIAAIQSGDVETGKRLLAQIIAAAPHNEVAWLWMSEIVGSDEQRRQCLEHVLSINPNNQTARRGLQVLLSPAPSAYIQAAPSSPGGAANNASPSESLAPPPINPTLPKRKTGWRITNLHVIIIAALGLALLMIVTRVYTSKKLNPQNRSSSVAAEMHTRLCTRDFEAAHELVYSPDLELATLLDLLPDLWSAEGKCALVASAFSQPVDLPEAPDIYQVALTLKNSARVGLFTRRQAGEWYITRSPLADGDSWVWSPEPENPEPESD